MNQHYPFSNPPLPYAYNALEPYIDEKTMRLHHDRHLQAYVNNTNNLLKPYPAFHSWTLETLLRNICSLPRSIQTAVKNNAGGIYNHVFYFNSMSNLEYRNQAAALRSAIIERFGSTKDFFDLFREKALSVFGSGYAWLVLDQNKCIQIITSANQDTPITRNLIPLINIDVWEHAYYLKHYNDRAAYIKDWLSVANWARANELYLLNR